MFSVTGRIRDITQPYGGYIPYASLRQTRYNDDVQLHSDEYMPSGLVGTAVDHLSRYINGVPRERAFEIPLIGAECINEGNLAQKLLTAINGLDDDSVYAACQLVAYAVYARMCYFDTSGKLGFLALRQIGRPKPLIHDGNTIFNIKTMVNRVSTFLDSFSPIVLDGFTFEGGYTDIISSGDGDILTSDTLWDIKTTKRHPNSKHTLQLLIYYIMGCHSIYPEFQQIKRLGIFNPRLNTAFTIAVEDISSKVIETVSTEVIGYPPEIPSSIYKREDEQELLNKLSLPTSSRTLTPQFHFGEIKDKEIYKRKR